MVFVRQRFPVATSLRISDGRVVFTLSTGGDLSFPLAVFPGLRNAPEEALHHWTLAADGLSVRWEALDEDVSIPQLLTGHCGPLYGLMPPSSAMRAHRRDWRGARVRGVRHPDSAEQSTEERARQRP